MINKKSILVSLTLFFTILCAAFIRISAQGTGEFTCRVHYVNDGSTIKCSKGTRIKLWGVRAPQVPPEVKDYVAQYNGGYSTRDYLREHTLGRTLECREKGSIKKHIVAQCFLNSEDIAISLLKETRATENLKQSNGHYSK